MTAGLTAGQTIAVVAVIWVSLAFLIGPLVGLWLRGSGDDEMSPDANGSGVDTGGGEAQQFAPATLSDSSSHGQDD